MNKIVNFLKTPVDMTKGGLILILICSTGMYVSAMLLDELRKSEIRDLKYKLHKQKAVNDIQSLAIECADMAFKHSRNKTITFDKNGNVVKVKEHK